MDTGRYKKIFKMANPNKNVPAYSIMDRQTDIYVNYNDTDRLDNMAYRFYGSSEYWWIILDANNYQIEFDIEPGEILRIPYPLNEVLQEIKEQV